MISYSQPCGPAGEPSSNVASWGAASLVQSDTDFPLLEAAISLAQDEYPNLDVQQVLGEVDQLLASTSAPSDDRLRSLTGSEAPDSSIDTEDANMNLNERKNKGHLPRMPIIVNLLVTRVFLRIPNQKKVCGKSPLTFAEPPVCRRVQHICSKFPVL